MDNCSIGIVAVMKVLEECQEAANVILLFSLFQSKNLTEYCRRKNSVGT